jgi:hypothetical protein
MEFSKCKLMFGTLFMLNLAIRPMVEVGVRMRLQERFMIYLNFFGLSLLVEVEPLEEISTSDKTA